jgi:hypothetical protein
MTVHLHVVDVVLTIFFLKGSSKSDSHEFDSLGNV